MRAPEIALTRFAVRLIMGAAKGESAISNEANICLGGDVDVDRLEAAIRKLVARHRELLIDNASLREQIVLRDEKVLALEAEIRDLNQRRQDVTKRIDDLIAQIEQIENQELF